MVIILILIIVVIVYLIFIKPFLEERNNRNFVSYVSMPSEIKYLIEIEAVFELADLLVELELERKYALAVIVLEAIDSKGFSFANRVDKIRNEKRIQAGLGSLKYF